MQHHGLRHEDAEEYFHSTSREWEQGSFSFDCLIVWLFGGGDRCLSLSIFPFLPSFSFFDRDHIAVVEY